MSNGIKCDINEEEKKESIFVRLVFITCIIFISYNIINNNTCLFLWLGCDLFECVLV
jgi:hypothetical protein